MNTLSWLIYFAEVLGNLRGVLVGGAILSGILIGIRSLTAGLQSDFGDGKPGEWIRALRYCWVVAAFAVVAALMPSTKTLYLIAASEAGETVVTSPDAIEMMGDLKAIIKKKLKEELGE